MPQKYNKFFIYIVLLLWSWNSFGQKLSYFQTFIKPPGNQAEQGCSILQLADKGFIVSGAYDLFGKHPKIEVFKTDSLGKVLWINTYGGAGSDGYIIGLTDINIGKAAVDMVFAPDSNIVICTSTTSYGTGTSSFYLLKIDKKGKVLWGRAIGENKINIGYALVNAPGGGFVLTGYTDKYPNSGDSEHVSLIKTNDTGGVVWAKSYGGLGFGFGLCISTTRDGGYVVGGTAGDDTHPYSEDALILKVDKNGKLLWNKIYGTSDNEWVVSLAELPDHSIYAYGYADANYTIGGTIQLAKLDSTGNLLWAQNYGNINGIGDVGYPSAMYYDIATKSINMTSFLPDSAFSYGLYNLKTDASGQVKHFKEYSTGINVATGTGASIVNIAGGGSAMVSSSYSNSLTKARDIYFVKVDSGGASNLCTVPSRTVIKTTYPMADHTYSFTTKTETPSVVSGYESSTIVMTDTSYCAPFFADFRYKNNCPYSVQFYDSTYEYPTSWKWNFGEIGSSSNISTLKNPAHAYTKPGTYKVKLVAGNGTVKDSITKTVIVYPFPAPFKFDTTICSGSTITLGASGGATYKWSPAKLLSSPTSATPTATPKRTTTFIVQAISAYGCITSDTVHVTVDNKPAPPRISYATIKTGSEIEVRFQRSDSNDVKAYQVLRSVNGGAFSLLQSINNPSNSDSFYFIKDSSVNAAANTYSYKILALDSCGAVSDTTTAHQPMLLAVKQVGCEQALQLSWSSYMGWPARVYQILRSANGGADSLIATLAGAATTYNDTGLNHLNKYCYTILAQDSIDSFRSYSNTVCKQTFFPDTPQVLSVSKISTSTTNGTVVIKWGGINQRDIAYNELYFSRDVKNFSLVGSHLLPGIDSFAQSGLDTKDSDYEYYLVTVDSCGAQSIQSPVSKTMTLTVTVGQLLHKLNWTPYLGFKIKIYDIERFENGQFVTIDSVPGTDTFSKEFPAPCNYAIRYRIAAIGYGSGETAWSDTMGRQAIDTIPSDPPIMVNATVLSGSSAKINFTGSDSADTYQFAIQRSVDGNWGTAGTILFTKPGDLLQFTDAGLNTVKNHICYTVITLDSCLNASSSDTFCLINLQGKGVQMSDSLYWYPFAGYGLKDYAVLTLGPSGVWDTLTTVNASDTAYYNANLKCGQTITYKIAGTGKTGSRLTFSDSITITPFDTIKPPAPALYYATVLPDQTVKLNWQWNPAGIVKYFEVWRSTNHAPPVLIDSVTEDSVYIDKGANVKNNLYSYSITAIDSCNTSNRSKPSQTDSLMKLKLYSLYCSPQVQVHWTPFTGLPNGVSGYNILRSTDGADFIKINSVSPSATVYIDTNVVIGKQYYYKTEAIDSKSGYSSASDTLGIIPRIIPDADSAQLVYATVLKSDENNGAIYIRWKRAPLNDTNARGYYVYSYNSKNGKYALLKDVTNLNDTSFINNNINTLQDIYKYYIITYNVCDVGVNSNIHKTVLLKVQNNNLQEQLNWSNYLGVPVRGYSVYKSEDGGAQFLLGSAALDSSRSDSNVSCGHSFTYQVQAMLANGEISFSDSITVKSFDTIAPKTKPIVVVTVVRTGLKDGRIKIDWLPAFDKNLEGYNIYRSNDGLFWLPVASGFAGIEFIDTGLNTYGQSYYYKIQPVDSCGNVGAVSSYQRTVNMKAQASISSATGQGYNQLSWNGYEGWNVKKYLLYRDGILIDTVDNNVFDFKDTEVICNVVYNYLIKAIDTDNDTVLSSSNTDSAKAANHNPPQKVYIKTVTVSKPNKEAFISWTPSKSYDVKDYLVYRKDAQTGDMQLTGSTTAANYSDSTVTISAPLGVRGGCYYVFARDHCGNISDASNEGCIILLNAQNQPGYNQLSWNSYQYWPDGVQSYNVYKNEDSTGWQLIGTTSSVQVNQFKDSKLGDSTIDFCYQVQAIENPGQYNQLSRSTVVCVHQDATVFIPNTFTPYNADGLNDYFAPKGLYIKSYDMKIYNQWGELVYAGSIPQAPLKGTSPQPSPGGEGAGWDGTFHGVPVQQGVYIYLITVTDYNNKQSHFKGTITMFE